MSASIEMPRYQCHKKVHALQIAEISGCELRFKDERYAPMFKAISWFNKHMPEAGGYFIVYEDGYESYSPMEAFESGYTLIGG